MHTILFRLQALCVTHNSDGEIFMLLYCIITLGVVQFLMSQLPDLPSHRFLNALSHFCTVTSPVAVDMALIIYIMVCQPLACVTSCIYHTSMVHIQLSCSLVQLSAFKLFAFVMHIQYITGPLPDVLVHHSGQLKCLFLQACALNRDVYQAMLCRGNNHAVRQQILVRR